MLTHDADSRVRHPIIFLTDSDDTGIAALWSRSTYPSRMKKPAWTTGFLFN